MNPGTRPPATTAPTRNNSSNKPRTRNTPIGPHATSGAQVKGEVRYVVSEATDPEALLACLIGELQQLADTEHACFETTLLIHPQVLTDFADYNDFLGLAEDAISGLELDGVIQVASFHPQ